MVTHDTDVTVTNSNYRLRCNLCILATKSNKVTDGYTCYRWLHLLQQLHPRHIILILNILLYLNVVLFLITYYYVIGFTSKPKWMRNS